MSPIARKAEADYQKRLLELEPEVLAYRRSKADALAAAQANELVEMPRLLSLEGYRQLENVSNMFLNALKRIPKAVFNGDFESYKKAMGATYLADPLFSELMKLPQEYPLARPDTIFTANGFQFLEQNICSSITCSNQLELKEYFESHPVIQSMTDDWEIQPVSMLDGMERLLKGSRFAGKHVAVLLSPILDVHNIENQDFLTRLREWGVDAIMPDLKNEALSYENDFVSFRGRRIDLVYIYFTSLVFNTQIDYFRPLVKSALAGKVELFYNPLNDLIMNKCAMAYLSDDQLNGFLNRTEREIINQHLPWTRLLNESLLSNEEILQAPEKYIIKSGYGYSGNAVYFGANFKKEDWPEVLKLSVERDGFIIQKIVDQTWELMPSFLNDEMKLFRYTSVDSPYLFEDGISGLMTRGAGFYEKSSEGVAPLKFENVGFIVSEKHG